jgi:hypothetical protein
MPQVHFITLQVHSITMIHMGVKKLLRRLQM